MATGWGQLIGSILGTGIGSFGGPMTAGLGAGIGGGIGGMFDKQPEDEWRTAPATFTPAPRFEESDAARQNWWSKLQEWGGQPGYGAIQPDWDDIWNTAQKRVRDYFWGGPLKPGLADKVKASAARRGVSQSPAMEETLARMGAEEGGQLRELATTQGIERANRSEAGRTNWLTSLQNLTNLQMPGAWSHGQLVEPGTTMGDFVTSGVTGLSDLYQQQQQTSWFQDLLEKLMNKKGGTGDFSEYAMMPSGADVYGGR